MDDLLRKIGLMIVPRLRTPSKPRQFPVDLDFAKSNNDLDC